MTKRGFGLMELRAAVSVEWKEDLVLERPELFLQQRILTPSAIYGCNKYRQVRVLKHLLMPVMLPEWAECRDHGRQQQVLVSMDLWLIIHACRILVICAYPHLNEQTVLWESRSASRPFTEAASGFCQVRRVWKVETKEQLERNVGRWVNQLEEELRQ